jgi:FdhD protein
VSRVTSRHRVIRISGGTRTTRPDTLATEEPLEVRLGGAPITVTMRTPGDDFDLVIGFLTTEGVIGAADDVTALRYCAGVADDGANTYNVIDVTLAPHVNASVDSVTRNFYTSSSCGVCGVASIEAVRRVSRFDVTADDVTVDPAVVTTLPDQLRSAQRVFDRTGGLHAAGLFTADGAMLCVREDVGRHNAVDKVLGWAARDGRLPLRATTLMVSGRASFELTQKAVMAGVPVLAAVSAPSSLAVELAASAGLSLLGFVRADSMNVYAGGHRLCAERDGTADRVSAPPESRHP